MVRILLVFLFVLFFSVPVQAEPSIVIDGQEHSFEPAPVLKEGQTLVPVRPLFEVLGGEVEWEEETRRVIGTMEDSQLIFPLDSGEVLVNGNPTGIDVAAEIIDDLTFVPLRLVGESLGAQVSWDHSNRKVVMVLDPESHQTELEESVEPVSINTAGKDQLKGLPGIDEGLAQEIIQYREINGPFYKPEEVLQVPGIAQDTYTSLADKIKVNFVEKGLASWYGPGFHGRGTASGEVFDQYQLTAAHRQLPFGTYVRVYFPPTGKEVLVRINDRGPHVADRIIDLSRGAAEAIGLHRYGVGEVLLEVLGGEPE